MKKIILASASPRRKALLEQIGIPFEIVVSNAEENITKKRPGEIVEELSYIKGRAAAESYDGDAVIIAADTMVAIGDEILGKPKDEAEAMDMLNCLQGKTHQVYTGVTIMLKEGDQVQTETFCEKTDVTMFPVSRAEIEDYVATKEPLDKAGAYGIQGGAAAFIRKIDGDYNNVVGLPVGRVYQALKGWMK